MVHYELFLFYVAGFKPKDMIKKYGYSRASAYRFYHIFRLARKRTVEVIESGNSVSLGREN